MTAGLRMAKQKKTPSGEGAGDVKKDSAPQVKLSPAFHKKLRLISVITDTPMGKLIEDYMRDWVNREHHVLVTKEGSGETE